MFRIHKIAEYSIKKGGKGRMRDLMYAAICVSYKVCTSTQKLGDVWKSIFHNIFQLHKTKTTLYSACSEANGAFFNFWDSSNIDKMYYILYYKKYGK